jgi:hypothetical protein
MEVLVFETDTDFSTDIIIALANLFNCTLYL